VASKKWDNFYKKQGRYYIAPHMAFSRVINKFRDLRINKVLDLGCGSGRHLITLAEKGFDVTGVDFSPAAVDMAERWLEAKKLPGKVYATDINETIESIKSGSFEAVLAVNSIHYTDEENFEDTLNEINRILEDGGLLLLVVPSIKAVIHDLKTEQLFFTREKIENFLNDTYRILEFSKDKNNYFVILAQEK
jgi:SAM-dependent methyltransferase